jgi:ferredoxin
LESLECSLCKLCFDGCEPGAIILTSVLDFFILFIENCRSIPAKAMASEEIRKRAEDLDAKLAELV